jgi:glycerophosphoryl diester phosphodiesterase
MNSTSSDLFSTQFLIPNPSPIAIIDDPNGSRPIPNLNPDPIVIDDMPFIFETQIDGSDNAEQLLGDDRSNLILGKGGNDTLFGLSGADSIDGGGGNDRIFGGSSSDRLFGNEGDDILSGGSGNDRIYGGAGSDRLRGGAGNDVLLGNDGNNLLVGGAGNDGFVLSLGVGALDTILDFQSGKDKLGLPDGIDFDDLIIWQQGADTIVEYTRASLKIANDPIALLKGVQANTITAMDFAQVLRAL